MAETSAKKRSVAQSVAEFIVLGLGVKVLGFIRSILMASRYGITADTDAFYFVQAFIFTLAFIAGRSFQMVLIPILNKAEVQSGQEGKKRTLTNILNVILLISLAICALTFIFARPIMTLFIRDNNSAAYREEVVYLFRLGLLSIVFYNAASTLRSYLQSEMMFRESSLSLFPLNLTYIIYILIWGQRFGVRGLMVAMVLGIAGQLLVQAPSLKRLDYHYSFGLDWSDPFLKESLRMILPILLGVMALEFNTMIDKMLAFSLPTGAVSALEYSRSLAHATRLLFLSAITTVMYPLISKSVQEKKASLLHGQIRKSGRYISLMAVPMTLFMILFSLPIIQAIYQRGAFGLGESVLSSQSLRWYSLAILWTSLVELYQQVFFSKGNTRIPMINSVLLLGTNIVFNLLLIGPMKHAGLALGTALASIVSFIYLLVQLRRHFDFRLGASESKFFLKLTGSSLLALLVSYGFYRLLLRVMPVFPLHLFIIILITATLDIILSILIWKAIGIEEIQSLLDMVKKKFSPGKREKEGA